ncbi:AlpA family phage regulatory protein [Photobacterium gaetbulicola]|uniref:helix-turn-helix transcriptional regulator n=1 Tax=Photobacterium gaetbulicola TaxID=1295392 RepID=UPI0005CB9402|nr:AlpA family phage regulatory protein [Photobacterium gaetbulicola]PSU04480.1 AlpA family phage regulatory protein [Photobacterium gaetbulicola]
MEKITPELLTLKQVLELVSLSRSTTYRLMKKGQFPLPKKLPSGKVQRWLYTDILLWIENLEYGLVEGFSGTQSKEGV